MRLSVSAPAGGFGSAAGRRVLGFLAEALALLLEGWRIRSVRADSSFFDQALLGLLEERGLPYIIVAHLTKQVKHPVQGAAMVWRYIVGYAVSSFTAKLQGWSDTRRFVVVRKQVREARAAVVVHGAVLGRISRRLVLRLSQNGGGMEKHKALIHKAREAVKEIAPLLPRTRPPRPDWDAVAPGGCSIWHAELREKSDAKAALGLNHSETLGTCPNATRHRVERGYMGSCSSRCSASRCNATRRPFPLGADVGWSMTRQRSFWRESEVLLNLLRDALWPRLQLKDCLENRNDLQKDLAEGSRTNVSRIKLLLI